ncbi:MAG: PAS domain S-box protein, partial [bacterium]|nr:PAS domain S-box protein [bacterium]
MAKRKRSLKEGICRETRRPVLSGTGPAGAPSHCECGRNAELEAVLASTLDPVVTIDSFGTIRSASNSVERVFGWKPRELVGRDVSVLMPEPHRSGHGRYLANYRKTLKTKILGRTREFDGVRKDGTRFPIELSVSRADVPGQSLPVFVGIIKDVSERRAAELELRRHRRQLDAMVRERTRALEQSH